MVISCHYFLQIAVNLISTALKSFNAADGKKTHAFFPSFSFFKNVGLKMKNTIVKLSLRGAVVAYWLESRTCNPKLMGSQGFAHIHLDAESFSRFYP